MELTLIRNATMRLAYAGRVLLTDPFLAPRHTIESFGGHSPNPLVDLPMPLSNVVSGIELVLLSHLHVDHFDPLARETLPASLPFACPPGDADRIRSHGFSDVRPVADEVEWNGILIRRMPGQHGTGKWAKRMGPVSGFVLSAPAEPTLYWAGDTIWYGDVAATLRTERPDVVITHSSGARFKDSDPIVMDAEQTIRVCRAVPAATIVAVHLESLDHGTVSRAALREAATAAGISPTQLRIPADGESIELLRPA